VKKNWGILQLDATVSDQYIKYPTDVYLLNDNREWSEELIDKIFETSMLPKKPRTYRRMAWNDYLNVAKKKNNTHQCEYRIVSIHQPHVHPIVRGKARSKVEFGSKIGISPNCGYARVNKLSWDAYNECNDVEA